MTLDRVYALELDAADPIADSRNEFVIADDELIYLDGNSLGRLPRRAVRLIGDTVEKEWGSDLARSWEHWIDLPTVVGDQIAPLIGARPGEVLVSDQTSINLFKLASAALRRTGRSDIVTDDQNFPSDRYVLAAVAGNAGGSLRTVPTDAVAGPRPEDIEPALDDLVGFVSLSHVSYKSAAICDMAAINRVAGDGGALTLWDLSHSAGVLPVELEATGADLAVGCTYKYLNGGPGAPAFLYVRRDLQEQLQQPIPGWFGHVDIFGFRSEYVPAGGITRFAVGTPSIMSMRGVEAGVSITAEAGINAIRAKSIALGELLAACVDDRLVPCGVRLGSPRDSSMRGGHMALHHDEAYRISRALIDRGVVPDFREPDIVRIGMAPLYTRYVDVWDTVEVLADVLAEEAYAAYAKRRMRVT